MAKHQFVRGRHPHWPRLALSACAFPAGCLPASYQSHTNTLVACSIATIQMSFLGNTLKGGKERKERREKGEEEKEEIKCETKVVTL